MRNDHLEAAAGWRRAAPVRASRTAVARPSVRGGAAALALCALLAAAGCGGGGPSAAGAGRGSASPAGDRAGAAAGESGPGPAARNPDGSARPDKASAGGAGAAATTQASDAANGSAAAARDTRGPGAAGGVSTVARGLTVRAFTDVSQQAGVAHQHHKPVFEDKVRNIAPWLASVGAAAAAADFDNDGYVDLYVTDSRKGFPNALYRNNGDGTFTDVAEQAGVARVNDKDGLSMDAVWGDYDNDGFDDLYVAKWGRNLLFRNNRDGTFTNVTDKAGVGDRGNANAAIFFDADGDGLLDIYIGNYFRKVDLWHLPTTRIMHNSFESARDGGANVLYHNNGNGTFTDVSEKAGVADTGWTLDVGTGDYDNDGDQDLYVANDFGPDKLFRNEGRGRFTDVSEQAIGTDTRKGMNAEFGDFNNDGLLDIYVTNIMTQEYLKEGNLLFRNSGDGTFVDVAPEAGVLDGGWGWAAKFFDYDNDGDLDLYTANGFISQSKTEQYWYDLANSVTEPNFDPADARSWPSIGGKSLSGYEANRFWINDGGESFTEAAEAVGLADRGDSRGIALLDYDNDGDLDVYLVDQNQKAHLFRNEIGNQNHWVAFKLLGKADAIGARVTLRSGPRVQIREVDGGNGFASQSDRRLVFGLGGGQARIDSVEIRWPRGQKQSLTGVEIDQVHTLKEP